MADDKKNIPDVAPGAVKIYVQIYLQAPAE